MDCDRCKLNYGPVCISLPGGLYGNNYLGDNCPRRKTGRTDVGDFVYCDKDEYKFGAGTNYGQLGWYSGRGY